MVVERWILRIGYLWIEEFDSRDSIKFFWRIFAKKNFDFFIEKSGENSKEKIFFKIIGSKMKKKERIWGPRKIPVMAEFDEFFFWNGRFSWRCAGSAKKNFIWERSFCFQIFFQKRKKTVELKIFWGLFVKLFKSNFKIMSFRSDPNIQFKVFWLNIGVLNFQT